MDKGASPNYVWIWGGTPLDVLEPPYPKDKDYCVIMKEILKSYGAKKAVELKSKQISNYLRVRFTSDIDLCFMSTYGFINISDIPGANENELSEIISIYQSFSNKEVIDLNSEEPNRIKEFNDRGLKLVKSILSKQDEYLYVYFHHININDSGKWWIYELFVYEDTEFGLFEYQIPVNERNDPF